MGKAKIVSGGPSGKYRIEIIKSIAHSVARLKVVNESLAEIAKKIIETEANYWAALAALEKATKDLESAIEKLVDDTKEAVKATEDAAKAKADVASKLRLWNKLKMERVSLEKEKKYLEAVIAPEQIDAYCADLTENLSVNEVVGTAEIDGKRGDIHILPGGKTAGALGLLKPAGDGSAAGAVFNLTMFAWWQKFKPTFRAGRVTATRVSKNSSGGKLNVFCNVTLDEAITPALSSNININQAAKLENVPAFYMH